MVAPVVNAATAITYNGTGIWSWSSVSSWTNNSNSRRYTVNHNQSLTQTSSGTLSVRIMKIIGLVVLLFLKIHLAEILLVRSLLILTAEHIICDLRVAKRYINLILTAV